MKLCIKEEDDRRGELLGEEANCLGEVDNCSGRGLWRWRKGGKQTVRLVIDYTYRIWVYTSIFTKLDGVAPLVTDPPRASFTPLEAFGSLYKFQLPSCKRFWLYFHFHFLYGFITVIELQCPYVYCMYVVPPHEIFRTSKMSQTTRTGFV